jgi:acetyltransferase
MIKFHTGLSERSVYVCYFEALSLAARTAHVRLAQICFADPERRTVLVALSPAPSSGEQKILAVGRLSKLSDPAKAEHVLLVLDELRASGLVQACFANLFRRGIERLLKLKLKCFATNCYPARRTSASVYD